MENNVIVIIPAYEPPMAVVSYINELTRDGKSRVLVINDGSGEEFEKVFEKIRETDGATVISYPENRGKGYALKTAYKYCKENFDENYVFVTADCDGQHHVDDVFSCAEAAAENQNDFILGVRDFDLPQVPSRSRTGNVLTRNMFHFLYGEKITDTQTGLRACSYKLLDDLILIKGDRFEYEMNELVVLVKNRIPIKEIPIKTIYEEKHEDVKTRSHFKTFSDSFKVWKILLGNITGFILAGFIAGAFEVGAFACLYYLIFKKVKTFAIRTLLSTITARILSSLLNCLINKKYVFRCKTKTSVIKYYALFLIQLGLSYGFTYLFGNVLGLQIVVMKAIFDIIIGLLSYQVQTNWVFKNKRKNK